MRGALCLLILASILGGCSAKVEHAREGGSRIVSLDYCADQYVLQLADRDTILALSTEAERRFSYLRKEAAGIPKVRPRMADVLALQPDIVVRSYGGGQGAAHFLKQAGVQVVQLGYPQNLEGVRSEVLRVGEELGEPDAARDLVEQYDARLARLGGQEGEPLRALYMTPTGVTAGPGTLINELLRTAGLANFQTRPGWNPIPLERLAYEQPDLVAASFFESDTYQIDHWSAARHPIARAQMDERPIAMLDGAWTSCGAWFMLDAVEALSRERQQIDEEKVAP